MLRLLITVSSLALWHRLCWSWWPNHLAIVEYAFIISPTGSLCCNPGNNSSSQETSDSDFILNKLPLLPFFKYFPHSAISNSVSYIYISYSWSRRLNVREHTVWELWCYPRLPGDDHPGPSIRQIRGGLGRTPDKGKLIGAWSILAMQSLQCAAGLVGSENVTSSSSARRRHILATVLLMLSNLQRGKRVQYHCTHLL